MPTKESVNKRVWPLDTALEEMRPTRAERKKAGEIKPNPFAPSSRPPLAAYRGVPTGRKSTVSKAGIQERGGAPPVCMDSRLRGNDEEG